MWVFSDVSIGVFENGEIIYMIVEKIEYGLLNVSFVELEVSTFFIFFCRSFKSQTQIGSEEKTNGW